jgi:hypothetical protein
MEDLNNTATLTTEGVSTEPAATPTAIESQATEQTPQGTTPPKSVANGQVEPSVQPSSSQPGTRTQNKPSDYYRQRQKIQSLERTVNDLMKRIESTSANPTVPGAKVPEKTDYSKKVWDDPVSVIDEMLEERINQRLSERDRIQSAQKQKQEALELIFKNEQVSSDGQIGVDRIIDIIKEREMDAFAQSHPIQAAKIAIDIYSKLYPKAAVPKLTTPLAPKPGQVASTQSGNVVAPNTQKEVSVDELQNQLRAIKQQYIENPEAIHDPALKAKVEEIKQKLNSQTTK